MNELHDSSTPQPEAATLKSPHSEERPNDNLTAPPRPQPSPSFNYTYVPPVPRKWKFAKHDAIFALLGLPLGFLFVRYILFSVDGFVTTAFFLLLLIFCTVYLRFAGHKLRPAHRASGLMLGIFTMVFSLTASPILHGLCAAFLLIAIPWWTRSVTIGCGFVTRYFPFDLLDPVLAYPLTEYGATIHAISDAAKQSKTGKNLRIILLGLFITLPLTGMIALLLCSADAGISNLFSEIAARFTENIAMLCWQAFLGIFAGCWLFGMLYGAANQKLHPVVSEHEYENRLSHARIIPNLGLYAGVTPICLLYLLYVISQTHYFCAAFFGTLPAEMESYSQYARRGFFELCAIAIINLGIILLLTGCAQKGGKHRPKPLTFYASILCGFTLFIIATAIAKMVLYIDAYGLTQLRLFTAWFMLLLGMIFLVLLIRQFHALPTAKIITTVFLLFFGILCFARPDALIASYNIHAYETGALPELDVRMLCDLSDDAYLVMLEHQSTIRAANESEYFELALSNHYSAYQITPEKLWNLSSMWIYYSYE